MVVYLNIGEEGCICEMNGFIFLGFVGFVLIIIIKDVFKLVILFFSSGIVFEFSSEMFILEVSSEVGFIVFDEYNVGGLDVVLFLRLEWCCSFYLIFIFGLFQCQFFCVIFFSNQFDNGLDSDDDQFVEGVIINGSKVEVEVDIYCCRGRDLENLFFFIESFFILCFEEYVRGLCFGI